MAYRDLFVPKLAHSNPDVRKAAVLKEKDLGGMCNKSRDSQNGAVTQLQSSLVD